MHLPTGLDAYSRLRLGAALALLQPAIDPVFLALLSENGGFAPAGHGMIVGASQAGMAAGALLAALMPRPPLRLAAITGLLAALATVAIDDLVALLVVRALFGLATGLLYAALLQAAVAQANLLVPAQTSAHAIGTILLFQLVVAAVLALVLPGIADLVGPAGALLVLAAAPLANLWLLMPAMAETVLPVRLVPLAVNVPQRLDPPLLAVFMFVAASAMIWSYVAAVGDSSGISDQTVGIAVALGSLAAGIVALFVAQATPRLSVMLAAILAALAMAMPLVMPSDALSFVLGMVAFNIGATYAFTRFSALAIDRQGASANLVPTMQAAAMVLGPLAGAAAVAGGGFLALGTLAAMSLLVAVTAVIVDGERRSTGAIAMQPAENSAGVDVRT